MRHQHQRAGKLEQAFFEDLESGDVEIVGGLVEQENVGRLEHELRDENAGALASGEAADGLVSCSPVKRKRAAHEAT